MQHMKITENLGELQKLLDDDIKTGLCMEDTLKFSRQYGKLTV